MLKSLVASCLCALSVNSSPLPSRAISNPNAVVGEHYHFECQISTFNVGSSFYLFADNYADSGTGLISIYSYDCSFSYFVPTGLPISGIDYFMFYTSISFDVHNYYDIIDCDDTNDFEFVFTCLISDNTTPFTYSFDFEVLSDFVFDNNSLPYLSKIENPYTPPTRSNLYRLLYDFYYSIFSDDDLAEISTGYNMPFDNWLAHTCTIITLLVLVFVCFLFLKWLFKVISGLILLKH